MPKRYVLTEADYAKALEAAQLLQQHWTVYDDALKAKAIAMIRAALVDPDGWPRV